MHLKGDHSDPVITPQGLSTNCAAHLCPSDSYLPIIDLTSHE